VVSLLKTNESCFLLFSLTIETLHYVISAGVAAAVRYEYDLSFIIQNIFIFL